MSKGNLEFLETRGWAYAGQLEKTLQDIAAKYRDMETGIGLLGDLATTLIAMVADAEKSSQPDLQNHILHFNWVMERVEETLRIIRQHSDRVLNTA